MLRANLIIFYLLLICTIIENFWFENRSEQFTFKLILNRDEKYVNDTIMRIKLNDCNNDYILSNHFFKVRDLIEKTELFEIIKLMPKGCLLHGHDFALTSYDYIYSLTYKKNLYTCLDDDNRYQLRFFKNPFSIKSCKWMLLSEMRKKNNSFDYWLQTKLSFIVDNPYNNYPDANVVSDKLHEIFSYIEPIITFKDVFEDYFYQLLEHHYIDNVMYLEFRSYLPYVYDLNGKKYGPVEIITIYKEVLRRFMKNYVEFQGAKLIYAPLRKDTNITIIEEYIRVYKKIKLAHPDFVIGFDLIGNENFGIPLTELLNILPNDILYYFNGAEIKWYGGITDTNVMENVLLGTKRISHGYSLMKHPQIMKIVKERCIAIEVCPISNHVFHLVSDLRNHPASLLIKEGYPIVIGNDYPSFWGAKGLSYDWYLAFIAFKNNNNNINNDNDINLDLCFLKQLALNSYLYNSMDVKMKKIAIKAWLNRWNLFIKMLRKKYTKGFLSIIIDLFTF